MQGSDTSKNSRRGVSCRCIEVDWCTFEFRARHMITLSFTNSHSSPPVTMPKLVQYARRLLPTILSRTSFSTSHIAIAASLHSSVTVLRIEVDFRY